MAVGYLLGVEDGWFGAENGRVGSEELRTESDERITEFFELTMCVFPRFFPMNAS